MLVLSGIFDYLSEDAVRDHRELGSLFIQEYLYDAVFVVPDLRCFNDGLEIVTL